MDKLQVQSPPVLVQFPILGPGVSYFMVMVVDVWWSHSASHSFSQRVSRGRVLHYLPVWMMRSSIDGVGGGVGRGGGGRANAA